MAFKVPVKHITSRISKNGYLGFSWTYLFFGGLVPVCRGEISIGVLHVIMSFFSFGITHIIFAFIYNKQHMIRMLTNGWEISGTSTQNDAAKRILNIHD